MNVENGIDALDLRSGKALWTTGNAQKPLLLLNDTLLAQAESMGNVLRLALLDTEKRGAVKTQITIDLPEKVRASIDGGPGTTFRVKAWMARELMVSWRYSEAPIAGAEPDSTANQWCQLGGTVSVQLQTGVASIVASNELSPDTQPPLPAKLLSLEQSGRLQYPIWRAGNVYATVQTRPREDAYTVLKRWDTAGDSLPDVTLFTGQYSVQHPSADKRHLLVSRLHSSPPALYDWLIFSLADGAPVAELRSSSAQAWFFVTGSVLIHSVPARSHFVEGERIDESPKLGAIDLRTGATRWAWPLRDTSFRGNLPPATPKPDDEKEQSG